MHCFGICARYGTLCWAPLLGAAAIPVLLPCLRAFRAESASPAAARGSYTAAASADMPRLRDLFPPRKNQGPTGTFYFF